MSDYTIKTEQFERDLENHLLTAEITHKKSGEMRIFRIVVDKDGLSISSYDPVVVFPESAVSVRIDN